MRPGAGSAAPRAHPGTTPYPGRVEPDEAGELGAGRPRADTAVSPIIQGEPVDIPTPVWGALVEEDLRRIEADEFAEAEAAEYDGVLPRPRRLLGWLSVLAAVVTAVLHGLAVAAAGYVDPGLGTALAWGAIAASVAAVVLGVTAAVLGRGRWLGVIGAVCGFLANPWVVLQVLRLFAV